ncbi:Uncharacterised protein [Mesomycoplasma conjunctivae]|uniref:Uncharacterized protein n=1 Tax=Mesomycoplasma conjunctivae (strain ATCC 25834 / NCTC 10147 / HRC/581) TaxID=572263 RepID=C5J5I1_MESCH|nr:hypothetical protein [Mesomycoplasma conjunctivae]CAT04704.1 HYPOTHETICAL PROTEIN MCJ_000250 [Mesomycoplasma conjunctivae]VEU65684.1 Uncharacterised protein [Mesomycoplasma conjunctivae]
MLELFDIANMKDYPDQEYFIEQYFYFIEKLVKQNRPSDKYKNLKIGKYYKNFIVKDKFLKTNVWFYQRHHIEEISISGAILQANKEKYENGLSIILTWEEHAFVHYLIVCANTTLPNYGMLMQLDFTTWDQIAKKYCKEYNIKYIENWDQRFTGPINI